MPNANQMLVTIDEAAARLAMCRSSIYNLIWRGTIVPVYLDRRPRIRVSDLEALVAPVEDEAA